MAYTDAVVWDLYYWNLQC